MRTPMYNQLWNACEKKRVHMPLFSTGICAVFHSTIEPLCILWHVMGDEVMSWFCVSLTWMRISPIEMQLILIQNCGWIGAHKKKIHHVNMSLGVGLTVINEDY